mgnify:CR=1 FL=1
MKIFYKPQEGKTKIFGEKFVKNNKDRLKMVYNNKILPLNNEILFVDNVKPMIKLIGFKKTIILNDMFEGCNSLLEIKESLRYGRIKFKAITIKNIQNYKNEIVFNKTYEFGGDCQLLPLPNVFSWWDRKNIHYLEFTISKYSFFLLFSGISNWDYKKLYKINVIFFQLPYSQNLFEYLNSTLKYIIKRSNAQINTNENIVKKSKLYVSFLPDSYKYSLNNSPIMIYHNNNKSKKIKIFGQRFVQKNKTKCRIVYKDEILPLEEYFSFENIEIVEKLEIKLMGFEDISDKSYMFSHCNCLERFLFADENECELIDEINDNAENKSYKDNFEMNKTSEEESEKNKENNIIIQANSPLISLYEFENNNKFDSFKESQLPLNLSEIKKDKNNDFYENFNNDYKNLSSIIDKSINLMNYTNFTNMSYMFNECSSLIYLPDMSKWNTEKVTDMSYMFNKCSSLIVLPNIPKWNTINVTDMSCMFNECKSLVSMPNISEWNTNNVINLNHMFGYCEKLRSLPDISKWKIDNVNDISYLFVFCESLESLPDISNWKTDNIYNMSHLFSACSSLTSLPNISNWNTENVIDISWIFFGCTKLELLPDISKWKTENVKNMESLFCLDLSLKFLPDLSKWKTNKVTKMSDMFRSCKELISLPDISNWNTKNVKTFLRMFSNCPSLISLPDISKWNTNHIENISSMFYGCKSLTSIPDISKWDTSNIKNLSNMFQECSSLSSLPNLSKWKFKNYHSTENMFDNCLTLINIPLEYKSI